MTDSEEQVFITTAKNDGERYHTGYDYQYVREVHFEVSLSSAKDRGLEECRQCAGEHKRPKPDQNFYQAALEARKQADSK